VAESRPEHAPKAPTVLLRPATPADAEQIRAIYNHEVLTSAATFDLLPRTLEDQVAWLDARSGAFTALVAVDPSAPAGGEIIGFGALSPYKERAAYRTSVENSVYVRADRTGQGVGRTILEELLAVAAAGGFHTVFARINSSGTASVALHASCGYRHVGVEYQVGRKFGRWHDVVVMQKML
jgi:phosphinothricin acetyltransferase